ncbi:hypothetical protein [Microvirga solisilvae]|uniref:hypothetical protein n=1 Tax=Microvirga solisilvae TaxID=2919498 RepID=UPI001FB002D7|nr:hypothetical protein [Microvirga solisilvae]
MRRLILTVLLSSFGLLSAHAQEANTRIASMPYSDCLAIIAETAQEMDEAPVRLVDNGDKTTVRINAEDGFVTVSCERNGDRMILTKSPVPEAAGMTAAR